MSRLGCKNIVYHGDVCLGELDIIRFKEENFQFPNNEIRICHISPGSERCIPLSILHSISPFSLRCKLESTAPVEQPHLVNLHASCFYELKTAVIVLRDEEIHLVAMPSKQKKFPCFWCYSVPSGLYNSCLGMLNMRCLAIVFDLDETLIVANTMKSFEDKIEALRAWKPDPMQISGMSAELNRYVDDRMLLKQYMDNDCVVDYGKVFKFQQEEFPPPSDSHERIIRPVIRLPERNIVLTRINPENRDTSVLVRLRPAWEDLKSYLIAKGRKRFEVYVCTMAERDYALEMWRLLDPEANLIGSKQLLDRVVCVKSGSRKSLLNVFQHGSCHPKMAMVIDDRSKVWEDKDQPRVHVVPAFNPYYAPQAETANAVPVLCVARNVACNVRSCFFKEFDKNLLRSLSEVFYEDEAVNLIPAPDVSNYLMSEDTSFVPNVNKNAPMTEGMNGVEVERRLNKLDEKYVDSVTPSPRNSSDLKSDASQPAVAFASNATHPASSATPMPSPKPVFIGAHIRRDNSSVTNGLDLKNQSSGQPPLLPRLPGRGGWIIEEEVNRAHPYEGPVPIVFGLHAHASQVKGEEASMACDLHKQNLSPASQHPEVSASQSHILSSSGEFQAEGGRTKLLPYHLSIGVLQELGKICSSKVLFTGEKIGVGTGNTRKDAQQEAAENALHNCAVMTFDEDGERKRTARFMQEKKETVGAGPSTQFVEIEAAQGMESPSIQERGAVLGLDAPEAPHISYPEGVENFKPKWDFNTTESVSTDLISAEKFLEGCIPPMDEQLVLGYDDDHLRSLMSMSLSSMMFLVREQSRRLLKSEETCAINSSIIDRLKASIEEHKNELDLMKVKYMKKEHELMGLKEELREEKLKVFELERNKAKLLENRDAKGKLLEELKDNHEETMRRYFMMGWNDCKEKILAEYPGLDLEGIEPSINAPGFSFSNWRRG